MGKSVCLKVPGKDPGRGSGFNFPKAQPKRGRWGGGVCDFFRAAVTSPSPMTGGKARARTHAQEKTERVKKKRKKRARRYPESTLANRAPNKAQKRAHTQKEAKGAQKRVRENGEAQRLK